MPKKQLRTNSTRDCRKYWTRGEKLNACFHGRLFKIQKLAISARLRQKLQLP